MADRIDNVEVGISLADAEFLADMHSAEQRVKRFADRVRRTRAGATVDLNLQKFRVGVKEVDAWIRDLKRKDATVAIRADTRGFLRAYAEVKLAMSKFRMEHNFFTRQIQNGTGLIAKMFQKLGAKGPFENFARGFLSIRLQLGFFSATMRQVIGILTIFGPIVEGVVSGIVALAGTLGSALVGATAAASAGLAGLVLSLGGVVAAVKPTLNGFKLAMQASDAYAKQVAKTGQDSDKAKTKLEELNSVMAHVPASSRDAIRAWGKVRQAFRDMTRATSERAVGGVLNQGVRSAQALMPQFARQTNRTTRTLAGGAQAGLKALRGNEIRGQIDTIMSGFNQALPSLLRGFGQLGALLTRIFSAASPLFVDLAHSFGEWATNLNNANSDSSVLEQTLNRMWDRFKNIFGLLRSAGGLMKTILQGGADSGDSLVQSLTNTFDRWNKLLQTPAGQKGMQDWFKRAIDTLNQLGPALVSVIGTMARFSEATKPIADMMLQTVTAIAKFVGAVQSIPVAGPILSLGLGFAVVAQKLGILIPILKGARALFAAFSFGPMLAAIGPAGWIIAGLTALALGLVYAYKKSETFRNIVNGAWAAVKSGFVSMIDSVLGGLTSMLTAFGKIASHIPGLKTLGKAALGAAGEIDQMRESLRTAGEKSDTAKAALDRFKKSIDNLPNRKTIEIVAGVTVKDSLENRAAMSDEFARAVGDGPGRAVRRVVGQGATKLVGDAIKKGKVGGMGLPPLAGNQGLHGADPRMSGFARIAAKFGVGVSSGRDDHNTFTSSGNVSYHSSGEALDLAAGMDPAGKAAMLRLGRFLAARYGGGLAELIHTPMGFSIKNGKKVPPYAQSEHYDHVHVAVDLGSPGIGISGGGPGARAAGDGWGRNAAPIWNYLTNAGFTPAQAAGIMGNLWQESRFNPGAIENNGRGPGIGIAQWSFGRASALKSFAASKRMSWKSLPLQLAFMMHELRGSESKAMRSIRGAHTIAAATNAFGSDYERYGIRGSRDAPARAIYNAFKGTGGSGPGNQKTRQQVRRQKKRIQKRIDAIDDKMRALRTKKANLPNTKAGKAQRAAINAQINKLTGQRVALSRKKRDLGTGITAADIPVSGISTTADITAGAAQAQVDVAGRTPGLRDDIRAQRNLARVTSQRIVSDKQRLAVVNKALKGKLKPANRDRLLGEKAELTQRIAGGRLNVRDARARRQELKIQRQFAGGRGLAGLDLLQAQAASTTDLADDQVVYGQQLSLWQQLLAARQKRGDIAGMTEAQQQINTINDNLKQINEQQRQQFIMQGVDVADYYVSYAELTTNMWDDVQALQNQYNVLIGAIQRANATGDVAASRELTLRALQAQRSIGEAVERAQEAPLLAQKSLAALTDTVDDDIATNKALLALHEQRLAAARAAGDYAKISSEADAVKSLRDELQQSQGNFFEQTRLLSEARQDLYREFGSNNMPLLPAGTPAGGKTVTVNNYYKYQPIDPHSWSQDVMFELRAAN